MGRPRRRSSRVDGDGDSSSGGSDDAGLQRALERLSSVLGRVAKGRARDIHAQPQRPRSAAAAQQQQGEGAPQLAAPAVVRPASAAPRASISAAREAEKEEFVGFSLPPRLQGTEEGLLKSRSFWQRLEYRDRDTGEQRSVRLPQRGGPTPTRRPASAPPPPQPTADGKGEPPRRRLSLTEEQKAQVAEEIRLEQKKEQEQGPPAPPSPKESAEVHALFARLCRELRGRGKNTSRRERGVAQPAAPAGSLPRAAPAAAPSVAAPSGGASSAQGNLQVMFGRLRTLAEALWKELHVCGSEQREVAKLCYYPETVRNYNLLFREVQRLCQRRELQERLFTLVELREATRARLQEERAQGLALRLAQRQELAALGRSAAQEGVAAEIVVAVAALRRATCDVIDTLYRWREEHRPKHPLDWHGQNYIVRIQGDMDGLAATPLAALLAPDFDLIANPLLLPRALISATLRRRQEIAKLNTTGMALAGCNGAPGGGEPKRSPPPRKRARLPKLGEAAGIEQPLGPAGGGALVILPDGAGQPAAQGGATRRQRYFAQQQQQAAALAAATSEPVVCSRSPHPNAYRYPPGATDPPQKKAGEGELGGRCGTELRRLLDPTTPPHLRYHSTDAPRAPRMAGTLLPPRRGDHLLLARDVLSLAPPPDSEGAPDAAQPAVPRLLTCEALIYSEAAYLRKAAIGATLRRANLKLRACYRMYVEPMRRRRARGQLTAGNGSPLGASRFGSPPRVNANHFADWVREYAPDWAPQLHLLCDRDSDAAGSSEGSSTSSSCSS